MVTAVDIAILVPEPVRSLAIKLSRQVNPPGFCLNEVDILPHVTLAMGFVEEVLSIKYRRAYFPKLEKKVLSILEKFKPFEVTVERMEGRFLILKKGAELEKLHRQITVQVDFVQPANFGGAYFVKPGEVISDQTKEYTNSFKRENSFGNWIPHITIGWDEVGSSKLKAKFPQKFTANEVSICQLGEKNTCRKVLVKLRLKD